MNWIGWLALCIFLCFSIPAQAAEVENCYSQANVPLDKQVFSQSTVVMLDETVVFDPQQREHIVKQITTQVVHGAEMRLVTFSAFIDGRYTLPVVNFKLASPLDEKTRYTMRKNTLRSFDACQEVSLVKAKLQVRKALETYFERASARVAKSAILATLRDVGEQIIPTLASKSRVLILVSDMLENSDVSSFYSHGTIREIDPKKELGTVRKRGLLTDLRSASVYVIGAGVSPVREGSGPHPSYRSTSVMLALKEFWGGYIVESNGRLQEFGQPLLLTDVGRGR